MTTVRTLLPLCTCLLLPSFTSLALCTHSPWQELILFSRADLERSIPSVMDGLKPGQRKILFACFKKKLYKDEVKVGG